MRSFSASAGSPTINREPVEPALPRLQAPVLSEVLVASHPGPVAVEGDPADRASRRASDLEAGPGCGKAVPLSVDPKAAL